MELAASRRLVMLLSPGKAVRRRSAFAPQPAIARLMAACPVIGTPLGVIAFVGTPSALNVVPQSGELGELELGGGSVMASPGLYGLAAPMGTSWLPLLSNVRCVPLLPT